MASTARQAFEEFEAKLALTNSQRATVSSRRSTTDSYLQRSFGADTTLPLLSTQVIGSAHRDTIIRPLDDLDVLAVFSNEHGLFDGAYRWDSQKFLYRVRQALSEFRIETVGSRGQAVRLFYKVPPNVDVVPAVGLQTGGYHIPSGNGGWVTTNPARHASWMIERNAALGYHLKPLVRLLKRWNGVHSNRMQSFHLEVVTATAFGSMNSNRREASLRFFEWAPNYLYVGDPAGHSGDLSSYLTWTARQQLVQSLQSSAQRAALAVDAENRGDHAEAIRQWRIIYGPDFPSSE